MQKYFDDTNHNIFVLAIICTKTTKKTAIAKAPLKKLHFNYNIYFEIFVYVESIAIVLTPHLACIYGAMILINACCCAEYSNEIK